MTSMIPLLLSTVSATVVSYLFLGPQTPFQCTLSAFTMRNIPFYILLGLFCGACSIYFIRTTLGMEDWLGKLRNRYVKWALCSLGLGVLLFLFHESFPISIYECLDGTGSHIIGKTFPV